MRWSTNVMWLWTNLNLETSPKAFKNVNYNKKLFMYLLFVVDPINLNQMSCCKISNQQHNLSIVPFTVGWGSIDAWHFHFRLDHDKQDKCQTSHYIVRYCLKIHVNVFTRVTHSFTCLRSVWFTVVVGSHWPTPTLNIDFEAYNDTKQKYSLHQTPLGIWPGLWIGGSVHTELFAIALTLAMPKKSIEYPFLAMFAIAEISVGTEP